MGFLSGLLGSKKRKTSATAAAKKRLKKAERDDMRAKLKAAISKAEAAAGKDGIPGAKAAVELAELRAKLKKLSPRRKAK